MVEKYNIHYDFPVVCETNIHIHTKMQTYIYIIHTFQRSVSFFKKKNGHLFDQSAGKTLILWNIIRKQLL